MLSLEDNADGVLLRVRVHAGARRNSLDGVHDGALRVSVTQAPEKGKANQAIIRLLSKKLGLKMSQIQLLSGATSAQKRLLIAGVTATDLRDRMAPALGAEDF